MFGKATLDIPRSGNIGHSRTEGLSDDLAMALGRLAAHVLPECDGPVRVQLESGQQVVIGHDSWSGKVTIGYPISMDTIRQCGGFREYANIVIQGPIL